jgi:hypothetical protein
VSVFIDAHERSAQRDVVMHFITLQASTPISPLPLFDYDEVKTSQHGKSVKPG